MVPVQGYFRDGWRHRCRHPRVGRCHAAKPKGGCHAAAQLAKFRESQFIRGLRRRVRKQTFCSGKILIQAAAVRIMKSARKMTHTLLVRDIIKMLAHRFSSTRVLTADAIRTELKDLVEREYLVCKKLSLTSITIYRM